MSEVKRIESLIEKRLRVEKKVKSMKSWYWQIPMYLVGTAIMIFMTWFINPPFWMKLVLFIGPALWWVFFTVQGLNLFLPKTALMKRWEESQIEKYMNNIKD